MTPNAAAGTRDVVVIGASAGGIVALPALLAQLPADLPAAIAIVQHLAASSVMHLVDIIKRSTKLRVSWAEHGDDFVPGRVLVAPPGVHTLLAGRRIALVGGPRENRSRPSINRLFRSAARHFAGRVVGVLLTGTLDDGVSGLAAIRGSGGVAVVQDPGDAEYAQMPRAAIEAGAVDRVVALAEMGPVIETLVREPASAHRVPDDIVRESALDTEAIARPEEFAPYAQSPITCPECGGPMWELGDAGARTFRCFLGHAETPLNLITDQTEEAERALWAAVRALQDRALTFEKLARDATRLGTLRSAAQYTERAREARGQAEKARAFLVDLQRRLDTTAMAAD